MSGSQEPEILNIEQASALLGVSVKTFHKVLHSENLPGRKVGREWKFSRRALIDWVGRGSTMDYVRDAEGNPLTHLTPEPTTDPIQAQPSSAGRRTRGWNYQNTPE